MKSYRFKLKSLFFKLIRPLFVEDIDLNENFNCVICDEPVLKRYLTCSQQCSKNMDKL